MQITIIVEDKTVICDGVAVRLPDVDWTVFDGDPSTKWDDVQAVQFETDSGQGHIEYRTIRTSHPLRPNVKPGDMPIDEVMFRGVYGWILEPYALAREALAKRERDAMEAAKAAALEASEQSITAYRAEKIVASAPAEDVDALKSEVERLRKQVDAQQESFRRLNQIAGRSPDAPSE